ncbi:AbrB family transcriptional regulator [Pseudooceanicola nanhaiensis]|uniref:AbrB family transcriptional regulator n=1 Tax=Pseudooceanicola nanhaiensis TaxID=375761 RepID=UPI001CD255DF|nr:AbrB family transcriptional regulator [Pseudooceanicola nanhaiensis]MCA0920703.1 AbrB family transcriptional regulator [Pseudooceanicola nanhaiensis]
MSASGWISGWPKWAQWALLIGTAAVTTTLLSRAGVPAALLLGPMVFAVVMGLGGATISFKGPLRALAQGATGVLIAGNIRPETLGNLVSIWPAAVVVLAATMVSAMVAGVVAGRIGKIDREAAIWGFLPGMAGAVIAMSDARGLDARLVAIIQVLRIMVVILCVAALSWVLGFTGRHDTAAPTVTAPEEMDLLLVALAFALMAMAPYVGRYLGRIPAGPMLVPMVLGAACKLAGYPPQIPHPVLILAYFVIGSSVGLRFDMELMRRAGRALPVIILSALALVMTGGAFGAAIGRLAGTDLLSGVLSAVPGSIDAVAAITYSEGADLSFVMTLQVMRLFVVILLGPVMARLAVRLTARR